MNGLLFLLCCILGGVRGDPESNTTSTTPNGVNISHVNNVSSSLPISYNPTHTLPPAAISISTKRSPTPPLPGPEPTKPQNTLIVYYWKECAPVLMVTGGLIIACTILLISTLLLACKACQLSARLKAQSSDGDLISNSEYWMGTARKSKSKAEAEAEPKETAVLMSDISQSQEDVGKEASGKGKQDGQTGKEEEGEEKKKEEGEKKKEVEEKKQEEAGEQKKDVGEEKKKENGANSSETSASEKSASNLQEGAADSQQSKAAEASTSDSKEEPKDAK